MWNLLLGSAITAGGLEGWCRLPQPERGNHGYAEFRRISSVMSDWSMAAALPSRDIS